MIRMSVIAEEKMRTLMTKENQETFIPNTAGLRLSIIRQPGILALESAPRSDDKIVLYKQFRFFISPPDLGYMNRKYNEDIFIFWTKNECGEGFIIEDPNLRSSCK